MTTFHQSPRLIYRAIQSPKDEEFFHQLISEPSVWENASTRLCLPIGPKTTTQIRTTTFDTSILSVLICKKETENNDNSSSTPIGVLALNTGQPLEMQNRAAMMGISIRPEDQGQGYGSEAIRWALEWAFVHAGLHRVGLHVAEWNERAIKVYERLGFVLEGRRREALWKEGRWWDSLDMGVLSKEWAEKNGRVIAV
ncbi:GNAT family acetyltransferase [Talaromyces pinophilus]|jgi:RimJ/RimL family protein N-acetyltransferase|uniref:GNAT family acetyltransferase n=1 Tax=Talaromyces pinophilus TaxID=128442 RepID=A0A510NV17_TALPI|nr:GNAT family acetyltransferase [Talaromyces pinophilus]